MRKLRAGFIFLFFTIELSCATHPKVKPLKGSEKIKVYEVVDPAEKAVFEMEKKFGCRLVLKKVVIPPSIKEGIYENHVDEEIEIIGKNEAVQTGGNVVILEKFKEIPEVQLNAKYTGKIIVLKCP